MRKTPRRKILLSSADAVPGKCQHEKACSDCPWGRKALPNWLGGETPEEWVRIAHSDEKVECHIYSNGLQCAGIAIYRANVVKTPRDPTVLTLPADHESVFSTPWEFLAHHKVEK